MEIGVGFESHGATRVMTEVELMDAKDSAYQGWVESLVPLAGRGFKASKVDPIEVAGHIADGLQISAMGRRSVMLYFIVKPVSLSNQGPSPVAPIKKTSDGRPSRATSAYSTESRLRRDRSFTATARNGSISR